MHILTAFFASVASYIVNAFGKPRRSAYSLSMRANMEWKVPIHRRRERSRPTMDAMRSFISLAALLVKVRAMMEDGSTPDSIRHAIFHVSTRVFPDPAPAIIIEAPSAHLTASC